MTTLLYKPCIPCPEQLLTPPLTLLVLFSIAFLFASNKLYVQLIDYAYSFFPLALP